MFDNACIFQTFYARLGNIELVVVVVEMVEVAVVVVVALAVLYRYFH